MADMSEQQLLLHWEQAKRDVEKDLRSPALRKQIWDRARKFKKQWEEEAKRTPLVK
jgi:hypothetical protein